MPKYLFDTNIFIQAKNLQYQFCFCQSFWEWISVGHDAGLFFSSKKVFNELKNANAEDEAKQWAENSIPSTFFVEDIPDGSVLTIYGKLMQWANGQNFTPLAIEEFARHESADAFLIALAAAKGYTIVTHENYNPDKRNRILIPNAARAFNVETIIIYDLLKKHASPSFVLAV